jgi:hypothetical protein
MDDDNAESKLSKLAPPEDEDVQLPRDDDWYHPGSGGGCPVAAWYFAAHSAAAPPATAKGM